MTTPARRTLDRAMSERAWTATVIGTATTPGLARTLGWTCLHVHDSRKEVRDRATGASRLVGDTDAAGLPDWLLLRERLIFVELKAARGRLRPAQAQAIDAIARAGGEVYVWRPEHWLEAVDVLTRRVLP